VADGPKFSCPECGKEYPWKAELAGKKGKCKCGAIMHVPASSSGVAAKAAVRAGGSSSGSSSGSKSGSKGGSSVMPGSSHFATRARPTPKPVAVDNGDSYSGNGESGEQDVVVAPPVYSPAGNGSAAPGARATGTKFAPAAPDAPGKPPLKWAPALRWYGLGVAVAAWAMFEFSSPLDPNQDGRIRKFRLPIMLVNMILGPMGGGIVLSLGAVALFVVGTLILLGKAKDSDYEHEQAQGAWPKSRGRK
jgi:hypothetical protein